MSLEEGKTFDFAHNNSGVLKKKTSSTLSPITSFSLFMFLPFICFVVFFFHPVAWRHFGNTLQCTYSMFHLSCPSVHHLIHRSLRTFKFLSALAKLLGGWLVVLSLSPIKALKCRMSASSKSFVRHGFAPRASQRELLLNSSGVNRISPNFLLERSISLNVLDFLGEVSSYWTRTKQQTTA